MPELCLEECPRCSAERIGCEFAGDFKTDESSWITFWVCRKCFKGIVAEARWPPGVMSTYKGRAPADCNQELRAMGFDVQVDYPKPHVAEALEHVPDPIACNYREATDSLRRRAYTSAAMMLRRVLDRATQELAPKDRKAEFGKMRLIDRIAELPKGKALTPAMCEWANVIRQMGNDAEHGKDADEASATELHHFTELFLIYAFTLPTQVQRYGKKTRA